MASQPASARRCLSCNRWGGQRRPGDEPDSVEFDPDNDRGPCVEGPWNGTLRSSRNACGRWIKWLALPQDEEQPAT